MRTNRSILFTVITLFCLSISGQADARGGGVAILTPKVIYIAPQSDATVDLSGKTSLLFSWSQLPIPGGNRDAYRIVVRKEPDGGAVVNQIIDEGTFSLEVPARAFEDGARYSWHVRQRDAKTMIWSQYDIWYFQVARR